MNRRAFLFTMGTGIASFALPRSVQACRRRRGYCCCQPPCYYQPPLLYTLPPDQSYDHFSTGPGIRNRLVGACGHLHIGYIDSQSYVSGWDTDFKCESADIGSVNDRSTIMFRCGGGLVHFTDNFDHKSILVLKSSGDVWIDGGIYEHSNIKIDTDGDVTFRHHDTNIADGSRVEIMRCRNFTALGKFKGDDTVVIVNYYGAMNGVVGGIEGKVTWQPNHINP